MTLPLRARCVSLPPLHLLELAPRPRPVGPPPAEVLELDELAGESDPDATMDR